MLTTYVAWWSNWPKSSGICSAKTPLPVVIDDVDDDDGDGVPSCKAGSHTGEAGGEAGGPDRKVERDHADSDDDLPPPKSEPDADYDYESPTGKYRSDDEDTGDEVGGDGVPSHMSSSSEEEAGDDDDNWDRCGCAAS